MSMKRETIVERLEILKNWLKHFGFPRSKPAVIAVQEAIKLLKDQEPVEPVSRFNKLMNETFYWCGKCERNILKDDNYCPQCGRPVKWK